MLNYIFVFYILFNFCDFGWGGVRGAVGREGDWNRCSGIESSFVVLFLLEIRIWFLYILISFTIKEPDRFWKMDEGHVCRSINDYQTMYTN